MDQSEDKAAETPEGFQLRLALAQREHDRADRFVAGMFPAVTGFAVEALKAPALVNGGAAVAMLAFVGTGRQPVTADTIFGLKAFGVGLILAAAATALTYFAQLLYLGQARAVLFEWEPPFVRQPRKSVWTGRAGVAFHAACILIVVASYGCAVSGLWSVAGSLVPLPAKSEPIAPPAY